MSLLQPGVYDVIVVGGGPVGSHTAGKLAAMGHRVVVLERKDKLGGPVCCTGIISQECVNGLAIDDSVILRRVNSATLFSPSGKRIKLWRPEPQAAIIDRGAFDMALARRAQAKGAEYMLDSPARAIKIGEDGVRVEVSWQGRSLNLQARAVVVAAGYGSGLTGKLGKIGDFVMGAQAEVEATGVDEIEIYFNQELAPGFFAWLVPTTTPRALAGLAVYSNTKSCLEKLISSLRAEGKIASTEVKPLYRAIPIKPLPRTYGRRLVVVGDAAGQAKPTTGGGIYFGLLCAEIAASTLHQALEADDLSARNLTGYEREWRKKLGRELRLGYYARKFYRHLSDKQIDRIFDITKARGIDDDLLRRDDFAFDWHGEVILKLLGQRALARALTVIKAPFRTRA